MKRRATRLAVDQVRAIDQFAELLFVTFPHMWGVTHVGSSLTSDDWRDVDLRVVLPDQQVESLTSVLDLFDIHMLLSRWGQQMTGLPIDCQIQALSDFQRQAFGDDGAPRHNWRGAGRLGNEARRLRDAARQQVPDEEAKP